MDSRTTIFGTAGLGALLALFLGISGMPGPGHVIAVGPPQPERVATPRKNCSKHVAVSAGVSAADLLGEFFDRSFTSAWHAGRYVRDAGRYVRDKPWSLGTMVATIPDPIDSHLDWGFDFDLEAIRRAYERVGFVLDRFWLPWTEADTSSAMGCKGARSLWQEYPGIMLFRAPERRSQDSTGKEQRTTQLHVLFLIGEVPTSGIQKAALANALRQRRHLLAGAAAKCSRCRTEPVRIVGPLFSGSAISLRVALEAYLARHRTDRINILSGSATSPQNFTELNRKGMTFAATVNPDSTLMRVLKDRVIKRLGLQPRDVALLREGSTVYGQNAAPTSGDSVHTALPSGPLPTAAAAPSVPYKTAAIQQTKPDSSFLVIPFPMNISSLRTEYQRHPELTQALQPLPGMGTPVARLPVDLREPAGYTETPPVMSHLTPSALDLQLDHIAGIIRENRVRMVGILGTDIRDKLFLAEEVRKRVRDVQIFTFVSNVLLASPDHWRSLRGMIVLSTYPLIAQNQEWTTRASGDDRQRILAMADAAEGTYNATLAQLGAGHLALDYASPFDSTTADSSKPPVWISVIGRRAALPLAADLSSAPRSVGSYVLSLSRWPPGSKKPREVQRQETGFAGALVWLVVVTAGSGILMLCYYFVKRRSTRRASALRFQEPLYLGFAVIALLGVVIPTASLLVRAWWLGIGLSPDWLLGLVFALVPLAVFAIRVFPTVYEPKRRRGERVRVPGRQVRGWHFLESGLEVVVVVVAVVYLILIVLFSRDIINLNKAETVFFFRRASAIDSGVSPLLPVILTGAAFILWCFWHHQRIRWLNRSTEFEIAAIDLTTATTRDLTSQSPVSSSELRRVRETDLDQEHSALLQASRAAVRVRAYLSKLMPDRWGGALFVVLLLTACLVGTWTDRTLEAIALSKGGRLPSSFDLLFRVGLLGTLIVTAWSVYRFYRVWNAFRSCLQAITLTPLISAFDRLPQRLSLLTRLTLFDSPASISADSMASMQKQHLHRLLTGCTEDVQNLPGAQRQLVAEVTALMDEPSVTWPSDPLSHGFTQLYGILRAFWKIEPTSKEVELVVRDVSRIDAPVDSVKGSTTGKFRRAFVGPLGLWVRAAEEFAASQVVDYIDWVLHHLRHLALYIILSLLMIAFLLSSYPFQPQSMVKAIFFMLVLASMITLLSCLVGLNRDELLSRITKTTPGVVTWNSHFAFNLALFGAVPLLALASSELPGVREFLLGWVQPLLRALNGGL